MLDHHASICDFQQDIIIREGTNSAHLPLKNDSNTQYHDKGDKAFILKLHNRLSVSYHLQIREKGRLDFGSQYGVVG